MRMSKALVADLREGVVAAESSCRVAAVRLAVSAASAVQWLDERESCCYGS